MLKIAPLLMIFFFFAPSLYPAALSAADKRAEVRACDLSMKSCMHGDICPMKEAAKRKTALVGGHGGPSIKTGAKDAGCRECFRCCEPDDAYNLTQVEKTPFIKGATVFSSDGAPLPSVEFKQAAYTGPALPVIERPPASAPIV